MRIPAVRERVQITGRASAFLVMSVDRDRQVADLIPTDGGQGLEEDVPFASIVLLDESRPHGRGNRQGD
jgi:hypothetical protein